MKILYLAVILLIHPDGSVEWDSTRMVTDSYEVCAIEAQILTEYHEVLAPDILAMPACIEVEDTRSL